MSLTGQEVAACTELVFQQQQVAAGFGDARSAQIDWSADKSLIRFPHSPAGGVIRRPERIRIATCRPLKAIFPLPNWPVRVRARARNGDEDEDRATRGLRLHCCCWRCCCSRGSWRRSVWLKFKYGAVMMSISTTKTRRLLEANCSCCCRVQSCLRLYQTTPDR